MNRMPSSEFRKHYASIKEPTTVTVSGHPIGTWVPAPDPMTPERERIIREEWANLGKPAVIIATADRIDSPPEFRPAPKPSQRK